MRKPTALKIAIVMSGRHQKEIAAEVGIDQGALSRIVNGLHPSLSTRQSIAEALGRDVTELWPDLNAEAEAA